MSKNRSDSDDPENIGDSNNPEDFVETLKNNPAAIDALYDLLGDKDEAQRRWRTFIEDTINNMPPRQ